MLMKSYHLSFFLSMMFGTILACSSSSWVLVWVGLEINLMSVTPLLLNKLSPHASEMTVKYFLSQAMASVFLIFSIMFIYFSKYSMNSSFNLLVTVSLAVKAGVAPFHFWFPQVMDYSNWWQASIILTWQKIAPLFLLSYFVNPMTFLIILMSALIGGLGAMNQSSLKKILTFSSFVHSAWLIGLSTINQNFWLMYFMVYSFLTLTAIYPFLILSLESINDIVLSKTPILFKYTMFINILSMAGLPPFIGFTIKLISFNIFITYNMSYFILYSLVFSSLISFYFYSRLLYSAMLLFNNLSKVIYLPPMDKKLIFKFIYYSILGNILISFLVLLS